MERETLVWLVVLSVPPGLGMTGFVAVAFQRGAVSGSAVAAGSVTTLAVAALVWAAVSLGDDGEPP